MEKLRSTWVTLPRWSKNVAKVTIVCFSTVIGLKIWVLYREQKKKYERPRWRFLSKPRSVMEPQPNQEKPNQTNSQPVTFKTPFLPVEPDISDDMSVSMSSSIHHHPANPHPSMSSSVNDLDEFRLIHSQIQRGLHDLQAGLKKLKSPSDTPDETILPPTPSGDANSRSLTPVKLSHPSSRRRHLSTSTGESNIVTEINHLVQRVDRMIRSSDDPLVEIDSVDNDDGESVRSNRTLRQSSSISSLDSYMTCYDEVDYSVYQFLHVGIQHAEQGLVEARKVHRYQMFNQRTKTEYLAKLYCLRRVDRVWLADAAVRDWLREMTLGLLKGLMRVDHMDTAPLEEHFDTLLDWSWRHPEKLRDELREQGVADLSLFDVIIDWCLLDAVDFQANLPASIGSILANRWVDDNYKRTGMTSEVWSFIKKKRALILHNDCFMTRFYDLCQALVPSLAWGTLGPTSPYSELCRSFKAELLTLCTEIFASSDAWKSQRLLERRYSALISKTFSRLFTALSDVTGDSYHYVDVPLVARRTYSESSTSTINDEIGC